LPFFYDAEELFYPKLRHELKDYSDEHINVLLLGGSVLYFSSDIIRDKINFKVYNLAKPTHTSLDSLNKYQYLISQGYNFDYIIFYHGINEVIANYVDNNSFSIDYNHFTYYQIANSIFRNENKLSSFFIKKVSLIYRINQFYYNHLAKSRLIDNPEFPIKKETNLKFGEDIKSKKSFRKNLMGIIDLSKSEGSTLIVPIFAFNLPSDYPSKLLKKESLGYSISYEAVNPYLWGYPKYTIKGIKAHNEAILNLSNNFVLIDTKNISKDIKNFADICHFSKKGKEEFRNLMVEKIKELEDDKNK